LVAEEQQLPRVEGVLSQVRQARAEAGLVSLEHRAPTLDALAQRAGPGLSGGAALAEGQRVEMEEARALTVDRTDERGAEGGPQRVAALLEQAERAEDTRDGADLVPQPGEGLLGGHAPEAVVIGEAPGPGLQHHRLAGALLQ